MPGTQDQTRQFPAMSGLLLVASWAVSVVVTPGHLFGQEATSDARRIFQSSSRLTLGTQSNRSASVRLGDLDGDRDLDIVVANGRHWPQQNFLFLNQGRGRFQVQRRLGADLTTSYATELADLDGDGDLDVAVGNDMAPNAVLLNQGKGRFGLAQEFGAISSVRSLVLADIDGDGDQDILSTCRGMPNQIYLNNGKARFGSGKPFGRPRDSTIDVAVGDVNLDGHLDLVLANRDSQTNEVLLNDGQLNFNRRVPFGGEDEQSRAVAIADLNRDGNPDLVVGNIGQSNRIFLGDGSGAFANSIPFGRPDGRTYALAVADMDKDGDLDVVVGNVQQANAVWWVAWDRPGDGKLTLRSTTFGEESSATYGLDVGDVDGDGYNDIVTANSGTLNMIFLNRPESK